MRFRFRRWKRRLGVSTVVANMMMIVITLSLAAILVAWAGTTFGTFSGGSQLFFNQRGQALQERFVIETMFFNNTSGASNIMIFVRNVGVIDIQVVAIYVNGNSLLPTGSAGYLCKALPVALGVQQVCEFNMLVSPTWTSGTVFTVVVASARGNQVVGTARGP